MYLFGNWEIKTGEKWGGGEGTVYVSDLINKKEKLDTEYNFKTALSLHPTD